MSLEQKPGGIFLVMTGVVYLQKKDENMTQIVCIIIFSRNGYYSENFHEKYANLLKENA